MIRYEVERLTGYRKKELRACAFIFTAVFLVFQFGVNAWLLLNKQKGIVLYLSEMKPFLQSMNFHCVITETPQTKQLLSRCYLQKMLTIVVITGY